MNPFGLNYNEDESKLEKYVYEAIRDKTAVRDKTGTYIFKLASLPITLPSNSILCSKICRSLEEALEFRLFMNGDPNAEDGDEDGSISANVEIVDDVLQVSI